MKLYVCQSLLHKWMLDQVYSQHCEELTILSSSNMVIISILHTSGVPTLLNVTISPAESTAVDMYLLMDLSLTMLQDLNNLRTTSGMLGS